MRRRANPTRSKVDLARIGFRISDEFGEVVGWKCRIDVHHVGQSHYAGDRDAVADEIKRKLLVEPRVNSVVRAHEGDCVAIGRRVERGLHADTAGRAGPVLNDKLLSQMIRQVVADDARDDVVGAAGRKRDDPAHRPRRIGLRPRDARDARQHGSACGKTEKISAGKFHFAPPFASHHSITSSARASRVGGTSSPSVLAVFKLITRSYLVGCWKGRSPAFSPRRIRSTYDAARRYSSTRSVP